MDHGYLLKVFTTTDVLYYTSVVENTFSALSRSVNGGITFDSAGPTLSTNSPREAVQTSSADGNENIALAFAISIAGGDSFKFHSVDGV
jgi:hypothetical protein